MVEKVVLEDVEKYGEVLLLANGRRLYVSNAEDATVASIWHPSAMLTVRQSRKHPARLSVTNEDTGETIWATSTPSRARS